MGDCGLFTAADYDADSSGSELTPEEKIKIQPKLIRVLRPPPAFIQETGQNFKKMRFYRVGMGGKITADLSDCYQGRNQQNFRISRNCLSMFLFKNDSFMTTNC